MLHVSLIGDQPIPNLLPIRFEKPGSTLLVYTSHTLSTARRLQRMLEKESITAELLEVEPYNYAVIRRKLEEKLAGRQDVIFNLTGGTKIMVMAAFELAAKNALPFIYLQSEGRKSILSHYEFQNGQVERLSRQEIPAIITIDDYLTAHLPGYTEQDAHAGKTAQLDAGARFERAIYSALAPRIDEAKYSVRPTGVADQIEIDMVLRLGNQVGIAELKTGGGEETGKRALDQLKMASEPTYLGTYTTQFFITASNINDNIRTLARERKVHIVPVTEYADGQPLPSRVADHLAAEIRQYLS